MAIFANLQTEEIKQKVKEYKEKTNYKISDEKKKEYNRLAYLKRKEKNDSNNKEFI